MNQFQSLGSYDRRVVLTAIGSGIAGTALSSLADASPTFKKRSKARLAIIGAGIGGISAAYFSDPNIWDVEVFEKREKIGGHSDTVEVAYKNSNVHVDIGAEFFHPDTHPLYMSLLEEIGAYRPNDHANDLTIESPGSVHIFKLPSRETVFNSKNPLQDIWFSLNFAAFTKYARSMIEGKGSWDITLRKWVDSLFLDNRFKNQLLFPWLSSLIGCSYEEAAEASARSILQTFAMAFPSNLLKGATTFNSRVGLQGYVEILASMSPHCRIRTNCEVINLAQENEQWFVTTNEGVQGPFDAVILNAPPRASVNWLSTVPWAGEIVSNLKKFKYFKSKLQIHTDPIYMPTKKKDWCAYNAGISTQACEGSAWMGALQPLLPDGSTVDIFKSWCLYREEESKEVIAERTFFHPHITIDMISAARELRKWNGANGLYFSGVYTSAFDLQESAVYAAIQTANILSPHSSSLKNFVSRLNSSGKGEISYPF